MNEFCPTCSGSGGIEVFEYSIGEVVTIPCPDCRVSGESADVSRIELAERVWKSEQQLKRYREALEAIAYFDDKEEGETTTRIDAKYIARKALEGEE